MKAHPIRSLILHIAATLCLSTGFVKAAERLSEMACPAAVTRDTGEPERFISSLPCGNNKQ